MPDTVPNLAEPFLEVVSPDGARRYVRVTQYAVSYRTWCGNRQPPPARRSPHLAQLRRHRTEANKYYIEDRGQRRGLFVNGEKAESRELQDGDSIPPSASTTPTKLFIALLQTRAPIPCRTF